MICNENACNSNKLVFDNTNNFVFPQYPFIPVTICFREIVDGYVMKYALFFCDTSQAKN